MSLNYTERELQSFDRSILLVIARNYNLSTSGNDNILIDRIVMHQHSLSKSAVLPKNTKTEANLETSKQ